MSKYGVISGPYFPVFSPNAGKYGPEMSPYLDTFHAVILNMKCTKYEMSLSIMMVTCKATPKQHLKLNS